MEDFSVRDETEEEIGESGVSASGAEAYGYGAAQCGERRDAAESRRRILDAAKSLFSERGVEVVSMYEIGREAGVGQGTLYRRYEHKGALCGAMLHESAERFTIEVGDRLRKQDPALEQLEYLLSRLTNFNEENASLLGAIRDSAGGARRPEMYRNPFYRWLKETVTAILGRGVERGEIPESLDIEYLSDAVLAPLNIDLYLFQRHELGMEPERITLSLQNLLLNGLRGAD